MTIAPIWQSSGKKRRSQQGIPGGVALPRSSTQLGPGSGPTLRGGWLWGGGIRCPLRDAGHPAEYTLQPHVAEPNTPERQGMQAGAHTGTRRGPDPCPSHHVQRGHACCTSAACCITARGLASSALEPLKASETTKPQLDQELPRGPRFLQVPGAMNHTSPGQEQPRLSGRANEGLSRQLITRFERRFQASSKYYKKCL